MFGWMIERSGVTWSERFWHDIPSVGVVGFGDDGRARIFTSESEAEETVKQIYNDYGYHCYVTKCSDLYPPPV